MGISSPDPAADLAAPAPAADPTVPTPVRRRDRPQRLLSVTAAVLLAAGLATLGATGVQWWSRIHDIEATQVELARAVDAEWSRAPERLAAGRVGGALSVPETQETGRQGTGPQGTEPWDAGIRNDGEQNAGSQNAGALDGRASGVTARLHIPRLRLDLVVVEGAGEADLMRGPGHIAGTPLFGRPGNVGIAGHRYPGVFWDLDRLREGDPVVVETRDRWYVYRVTREMIVGPSDVAVLAAHPTGAPAGVQDFLTLVTCDPVFTTLRRLIRQAVLVRAVPRAAGAPAELVTA